VLNNGSFRAGKRRIILIVPHLSFRISMQLLPFRSLFRKSYA